MKFLLNFCIFTLICQISIQNNIPLLVFALHECKSYHLDTCSFCCIHAVPEHSSGPHQEVQLQIRCGHWLSWRLWVRVGSAADKNDACDRVGYEYGRFVAADKTEQEPIQNIPFHIRLCWRFEHFCSIV